MNIYININIYLMVIISRFLRLDNISILLLDRCDHPTEITILQ